MVHNSTTALETTQPTMSSGQQVCTVLFVLVTSYAIGLSMVGTSDDPRWFLRHDFMVNFGL